MDVDETTHSVIPSDTAVVVALFGWVPAPTAKRSERRRTTSFVSGAGSYGPSISMPPTPSLSRATSVSSHFRERESTPTPSVSLRMSISQFNASPGRIRASSQTKNPWSNNVVTAPIPRDAPLVYCVLCQRRVGLWGYSGSEATTPLVQDEHSTSAFREHQKVFDLVKEHRSYCPYIVCSSVVPSFSRSPAADSLGNAIEGWRAVLTVVQRYELSQRQRLSRFLPSDDLDNQASSAELKGVEAMVAGVKTSGVSIELSVPRASLRLGYTGSRIVEICQGSFRLSSCFNIDCRVRSRATCLLSYMSLFIVPITFVVTPSHMF